MDSLTPEISDLIIDFVALDRSSLTQLSSVSQFFRHRLAPRIFCTLYIKNILRGENFDAVYDRLERILKFAMTSEWSVCVESIEFEMRLPDLQQLKKPDSDNLCHNLNVPELISSSFTWFPKPLTYLLSNLSALFPMLHTLKIGFPSTALDCTDTWDIFVNNKTEIEEDSYHYILLKLLDLTFDAVAKNSSRKRIQRINDECAGLDNKERSFDQHIKHFSISEYPPFRCDALLSRRFQRFLFNLISFSLDMCQEYDVDEYSYDNKHLEAFLYETIPESFLSIFYIGTCLEILQLSATNSFWFGFTQSLYLKPQRMGSLKKLVLECILLSYEDTISGISGLGALIKANISTLEVIKLTRAGWVVESFERGSVDHWGSFWTFLRENQPTNLLRLEINEHFIDRDLRESYRKPLEKFNFRYECPFYDDIIDGDWTFQDINNGEIPEFRKDEDFEQWVMLCNLILSKRINNSPLRERPSLPIGLSVW